MDPAMELMERCRSRMEAVEAATARGDSQVQAFYAGSTVLVTGCSGFMGRQLVEKLLRSCPEIKKVYLLLRQKKGVDIQSRLQKVLEDPVFEVLLKKQPHFDQKLVPVAGDTSELGLGMSPADRITITNEVDVIIHAAATTNMDAALKLTTNTNLRGTRELLSLAKECKHLQAVVYVSTAYSGGTADLEGSEVLEQFYGSPVDPAALIELVNSLDEGVLNDITPKLIQGWPNTYTFVKRVSEELVRRLAGGLPLCVVRPTIVISTYCEPVPGWMEPGCVYGANGITFGIGSGLLHVVEANPRCVSDLVPADLVNNLAIVAGWETARRFRAGDTELKIYTSGSSARNPMRFGNIIRTAIDLPPSILYASAVYYIFVIQIRHRPLVYVLYWLLHFIPAYFVDAILIMIRKKPILNKVYSKAWKLSGVLSYFMNNQWTFRDDNTVRLYNSLSATDKVIYNCDAASFQWREMMGIWTLGVRKYLMKDDLKGFENAKRKKQFLKYVHYVVMAVYAGLGWKALSFCFWVLRMIFRREHSKRHSHTMC